LLAMLRGIMKRSTGDDLAKLRTFAAADQRIRFGSWLAKGAKAPL
jgi:hypothetical protein